MIANRFLAISTLSSYTIPCSNSMRFSSSSVTCNNPYSSSSSFATTAKQETGMEGSVALKYSFSNRL